MCAFNPKMLKLLFISLLSLVFANGISIPNPKFEFNEQALAPLSQFQIKEIFSDEEIKTIFLNKHKEIDPFMLTAVINHYADLVFENIQNLMRNNSMDPILMPEIHESFHILLISGHIDMTNGSLQHIATIHRGGDVVVAEDLDKHQVEVTIPIAFDQLAFSYGFSAKLLGLGPSGQATGTAKDVTAKVVIGFNFKETFAYLKKLDISSGHISVNIRSGHPIADTVLNVLAEVVTTLLKPIIVFVIDQIVGGVSRAIVDGINNAIDGILHPTTPQLLIRNR